MLHEPWVSSTLALQQCCPKFHDTYNSTTRHNADKTEVAATDGAMSLRSRLCRTVIRQHTHDRQHGLRTRQNNKKKKPGFAQQPAACEQCEQFCAPPGMSRTPALPVARRKRSAPRTANAFTARAKHLARRPRMNGTLLRTRAGFHFCFHSVLDHETASPSCPSRRDLRGTVTSPTRPPE